MNGVGREFTSKIFCFIKRQIDLREEGLRIYPGLDFCFTWYFLDDTKTLMSAFIQEETTCGIIFNGKIRNFTSRGAAKKTTMNPSQCVFSKMMSIMGSCQVD